MFDTLRTRFFGWKPTGPALGAAGERVAGAMLRRQGHRILLRNHKTATGELDLVTLDRDGRTVVFVEVKTRLAADSRASGTNVLPEEAITRHKARKLLMLAQAAIAERGWSDRPVRIDVVAVDWRPWGRPEVRHYPNAVTARDA